MASWIKVIAYISIVPLLTVFYFIDNIRGYYRFKELCQQEKQLVITSKLERNVGWEINLKKVATRDYASHIAGLPYIKFVRFRDWNDHQLYDVYYVGSAPRVAFFEGGVNKRELQKNYELHPSDLDNKVIYHLEAFVENLPSEIRMSRAGYRVTDVRSKKIVMSISQLGYSTFDRERTLFDAPSGNVCGNVGKIWEQEIQSLIF